MYSIYRTEAIVLGSDERGETSKIYKLLSPDLGLVYAHAQGIRNSLSKLRPHLQHYAHIEVNLVRGKRGWRITQAIAQTTRIGFLKKQNHMRTFARIASLLLRLHGGEEANQPLFSLIREGYEHFLDDKYDDSEKLHALEVALVARILMSLGYWGDGHSETPQCRTDSLERSIEDVLFGKRSFVGHINKALNESHL